MSEALLRGLRNPALYPHPVTAFRLLETHISWILLTGRHAYKIKKPVRYSFLDFTTRDARRQACEAEVRLNRRLAGDLYEGVTVIAGREDCPVLDGPGEAIDYAVRMKEFPQEALLSSLQARGELDDALLDGLAERMARFHASAAQAPGDHPQCRAEALCAPMTENFRLIRPLLKEPDDLARLARLEARTHAGFARLRPVLEARIAAGCIRECHGDLHLGNIVRIDGEAVPFDGIEFNDAFRIIDTASDIAFLIMDLQSRDCETAALRVLNRWLECGGDYEALRVMRFYQAYRALVRAKVSLLRRAQTTETAEQVALLAEYRRYAALAETYQQAGPVFLAMTRGLSAVGKSRVALTVALACGGVRLRSDVERKRLFGADHPALYSAAATEATYRRLHAVAAIVLAAGYPVVLDATYLEQSRRAAAIAVAEEAAVPWRILDCRAPDTVIAERLASRRAEGGDPSDADLTVVARQRALAEPLSAKETGQAITVETTCPDAMVQAIRALNLVTAAGDRSASC